MAEEKNQKIKLMKIMEILRQETDEEHPMTKVELAARLVAMNISCSPRSLIRDIKLLNEQGYEIMERLMGHERVTKNVLFTSTPGRKSTCGITSPVEQTLIRHSSFPFDHHISVFRSEVWKPASGDGRTPETIKGTPAQIQANNGNNGHR